MGRNGEILTGSDPLFVRLYTEIFRRGDFLFLCPVSGSFVSLLKFRRGCAVNCEASGEMFRSCVSGELSFWAAVCAHARFLTFQQKAICWTLIGLPI